MIEHVLIVGSDRHLSARVREHQPGVTTTVMCRLDFVPRLRDVTAHRRVLAIRHGAPDREWIDVARMVHDLDPFTRIASFEDRDQGRCAAVGEALGLATHAPSTVANVNDKVRMRKALRAAGVDPTESIAVKDPVALREFVVRYGFPCIVKPVSGEGSEGVTVLRSADQLEGALERARTAGDRLGAPGAMVEQFHEGPQFTVEAFSEGGEHVVLGIVKKYSEPVAYVEIGHTTPARLDAEELAMIHRFVLAALDVLGVESGPTCTEIVLGAQGPRIIETHLRLGGDDLPALIKDTTGVDPTECLVLQTLGVSVLDGIRRRLREAPPVGGSAIWFAAGRSAGRLLGVDGLAEARKVEGVTEVQRLLPDGTECQPCASSDDRLACARATADNEQAAMEAARAAIDKLTFRLRVNAIADDLV